MSWVSQTYGDRAATALADIVEFTAMAARLVDRRRSAYDEDETLRLVAEAITHRIGAAVARLPDDFVSDHPAIEWRKIKGMRNIVAHDYARVDHELVWVALASKMPEVAAYVCAVLDR